MATIDADVGSNGAARTPTVMMQCAGPIATGGFGLIGGGGGRGGIISAQAFENHAFSHTVVFFGPGVVQSLGHGVMAAAHRMHMDWFLAYGWPLEWFCAHDFSTMAMHASSSGGGGGGGGVHAAEIHVAVQLPLVLRHGCGQASLAAQARQVVLLLLSHFA
jgi:hypothetical protein